jgi:hypothetical protein
MPWLQLEATSLEPFSPEPLRPAVKRVLLTSTQGLARGMAAAARAGH